MLLKVSTADGSVIQALHTRHTHFHPKTLPLKMGNSIVKCFDSSKCYVLKSNHSLFLQKTAHRVTSCIFDTELTPQH